MHNPVAPSQEIELGGQKHTLRYSHGDLATARYLLKKQGWDFPIVGPGAEEFWTTISEDSDFKLCILLYAGLIHEDARLTLSDVQGLITLDNVGMVAETVMECVRGYFASLVPKDEQPKQDEAKQADPLPSASGGEPAGPSASTISGSPSNNSGT